MYGVLFLALRNSAVDTTFQMALVYVITLSDQPSYFSSDPGERCLSTDHLSGYALSPQYTDRLI